MKQHHGLIFDEIKTLWGKIIMKKKTLRRKSIGTKRNMTKGNVKQNNMAIVTI